MPPIKFQHVVSCSSEDKVHKGENLLANDHYRKWKCANPGEKQISIILQLEKETKICGVDIGNEGSALIEVLVGRASDHKKDFQVLLVTSSFMSPKESRNETNMNQVRMFGLDKLTQTVANEKWDRLKIVCTQPFNPRLKYGLSFILLHAPDDSCQPEKQNHSPENVQVNKTPKRLGAFKLKSDEKEEEKVTIGSWFNKMKGESKNKSLNTSSDSSTGPLSIRNASEDSSSKKEESPTTFKAKKSENGKIAPKREASPASSKIKIPVEIEKAKKYPSSEEPSTSKHKRTPEGSNLKKGLTKDVKKDKPFHRIMDKVVFVLSGYENPQRSQIRDKALAMGASYKQDWVKGCTHLICAFANTPKYNKVKSLGGKIVTDRWILESYKKKKYLPSVDYKIGSKTSDKSDSESDQEIVPAKKSKQENSRNSEAYKPKPSISKKKEEKHNSDDTDDSDEVYLASTDIDESDINTEDELDRVKGNINSAKTSNNSGKCDTLKLSLPPLPNFFKNKVFYIYGGLEETKIQKLQRYIIGCDGEIGEYMNDKVNVVLTDSDWIKDFDEALSDNKNLKIVKTSWIEKCIKKGEFVSVSDYLIHRKHL